MRDEDADFSVLTTEGEWEMRGSLANNNYRQSALCQTVCTVGQDQDCIPNNMDDIEFISVTNPDPRKLCVIFYQLFSIIKMPRASF